MGSPLDGVQLYNPSRPLEAYLHFDLVDPEKLDQARRLLGTTSTRATLDMALELLLAQSDFIEAEEVDRGVVEAPTAAYEWE